MLTNTERMSIGVMVLKRTGVACILLFVSADLKSNPGPVTDPCGLCLKTCRRNQRAIQCDMCDIWYHAKCVNMSKADYLEQTDESKSWECNKCLFSNTEFEGESYSNENDNLVHNLYM